MRQFPSNTTQSRNEVIKAALIVAIAALTRLLPHLPNFSPIMAIAIFGGLSFQSRWASYGIPLLAMLASDIILGFHALMPIVYGSFLIITFFSRTLRFSKPWQTVLTQGFVSALFFFATTNFGVWAFTSLYPRTGSGLLACFVAATPFFRYSLLANFVYLPLMFGIAALPIPAKIRSSFSA